MMRDIVLVLIGWIRAHHCPMPVSRISPVSRYRMRGLV